MTAQPTQRPTTPPAAPTCEGKHIHVISLGAGVQSTMLYLLACERHPIMPPIDAAIFADTGEEPRAVYEHLQWLKTLNGPPIIERNAGNRLGDGLIGGKGPTGYSYETTKNRDGVRERFASIPAFTLAKDGSVGMTRRQCTAEYKVDVVDRSIRRDVLGLKPRQRIPAGVTIHQYMGLSFDEARRVLRVRAQFYKRTNQVAHFPLFESNTTRAGCKGWLASRVPHVVPRSACTFCPYHSQEEWRAVKAGDPADWARACEVDDALRAGAVASRGATNQLFVHRSCVPIRDADLGTDNKEADAQSEMEFARECEGMCGV
jgi:hypothetical protein